MKPKKVLITGVTGLLGKALAETNPGQSLIGTYLPKTYGVPFYDFPTETLDVRDGEKCLILFEKYRPDVVIHTASVGSVDYCETHKEETWEVNVTGTQNLVHFAEKFGSRFVFISSNAVYDGERAPYRETDPVSPINYYGKLKVEGEKVVLNSPLFKTIIRPILMYGWHHPSGRPNPVTWQLSMMEKGEPVKMVDDIYCNPLYSVNCADAIWAAINKEKQGVFNIAGKNRISRFDFAREVAEVFGFSPSLVEAVPNSYFKEIAPRPKDTSYCVDKMEKELGVRALTSREGLLQMKNSQYAKNYASC